MSFARNLLGAGLSTCVAIALQSVSIDALAVELEYRASLGGGHSDNIRRTETNEEDEDIAAVGLQFSFDQDTAKLRADVFGDLAYFDYRNDTYDSEVLGNARADVSYSFVPQRFEWVLTDNFGQVLNDPFAPATPDNRENINYLATGPDFTLGLGAQTRLRLGGRYTLTNYEDSPLDSDSVLAELALIRQLSNSSALSLNASVQQVEYDESTLNGNYDQSEVYGRYEAEGARTHLALDLGYSQIDRDAAQDTEDGLLMRLDVARRLSASSVLTLDAGREFSNSANAFSESQGIGDAGLDSAPGRQTAQPFTFDHAALTWDFQRNRSALSLFGRWEDRAYDDQPILDQTLMTFGVSVSRDLSQTTSLAIHATQSAADFEQPDGDYDELGAGVSFEWRLTAGLTLSARYDYVDRDSDLAGTSFQENRYWLSIGYGRGDPRSSRAVPEFAIDTAAQP